MAVLYTNRAVSSLAAGITNSATTFSVASGEGALFPAISGGDHFYVTLDDNAGGVEIVKVTARSTDSFTVVRAQDGTSAQAFSAGAFVELRITRGLLDDFKADARSGLAPLDGTGASGTWGISITGNAGTATQVYVTESPDDSATYMVPYVSPGGNANGNRSLYTDNGGLSFNPGTNVLACATFQGSLSGNASSATQLQTSRTINGTSFNGTASITTANWGSSRTLTIGSTGKFVNGSANVSWTLTEIGAQPVDADLTAIAALAGTSGVLKKTAANTWALDTATFITDANIDNYRPLIDLYDAGVNDYDQWYLTGFYTLGPTSTNSPDSSNYHNVYASSPSLIISQLAIGVTNKVYTRASGDGGNTFTSWGQLINTAPGTSGNVLTSNGSAWVSQAPAAGGQYLGSAATKAIAYNSNTIAENITITSGLNGLSAGPITINSGYTVTVQSGAVWAIV